MTTNTRSSMKDYLSQTLALAEELAVILEKESEALQEAQHAQIKEYADEKAHLLQGIAELDQIRTNLLDEKNLSRDKEGLLSYFAQSTETEETVLLELWSKLTEVLRKNQQQNLSNGYLINRTQQINETLISILHGKGQEEQIYGKQGKIIE